MTGVVEALAISTAVSLISAGLTYALSPTQKIEGARIQDLTNAKSSYGVALPWCWGKVRVGGNLIWTTYVEETKKKTKTGKGAKVESETFQYFGSFATMFAECPFRPLVDIPRLWMNKKLVYSKVGGAETIAEGGKFAEQYLRFYYGLTGEVIDPLLQNVAPISNYNYGIPANPSERDAFLLSLGINPNQTILTPAYNHRPYMVAQRLPLEEFYNALPTVEAELHASDNCTVGQIIADIFGLFYPPGQIDTSLIETADFAVEGFFINSIAAAKEAVQNLQKAFFFDIIQSGDTFKFIPLNHPRTIINLLPEDLAAHQSGTEKPLDYEIVDADPTTLPSEVIVSYIDRDLNYDTNEQRSRTEIKQYENLNTLSLTFSIVMSASQAATIAERTLFLAWVLARTYKFILPPAFLDLEPTDLLANLFDDSGLPVKLTQTRIGANLILECEAVPHDTSIWDFIRILESGNLTSGVASYTVTIPISGNAIAVADSSGNQYEEGTDYTVSNGEVSILPTGNITEGTDLIISTNEPTAPSEEDLGVIVSPGDTELLVLDIPLILDSDADYTLYLTGGGGDNWTGASIYVSTDNVTYTFAGNLETYGVFGTCQTVLGATGGVTVEVNKPELESVTDNDLELGFNMALIGEEIVQFKTAQLSNTNTYVLSDLTRGLRGTENEIPNHQVGERFVLLTGENAVIEKIVGSAADLGQVRYFKALSAGQALDQVNPVNSTILGLSQRPIAPVNIDATKDGMDNITITWQRRDRHAVLNTENPPLSETTEEYKLDIINSSDDSVIRIETTYISSFTYTRAAQLSDFGSVQSTITVKIAQVSGTFGDGSFAEATLIPPLVEPAPTITSFTPASAQVGTTINLVGTALAQVSSIKINDIEQTNLAVTDNENISFGIAFGSTSGLIEVTTIGDTAISTNALIVEPEATAIAFPFAQNITLPFTITAADFGKELIVSNQTGTLSIPDLAAGFEARWGCWVSLDGTGTVTIERVSGGTSGIIQSNSLGNDDTVKLWHRGANVWKVD